MRFEVVRGRGGPAVIAAAAAMALAPAAAHGMTFYASETGTGTACTPEAPCALNVAANSAAGNPGADTVQALGEIDHDQATEGSINLSDATELVGSGRGPAGTTITGKQAAGIAFTIEPGSSARDLSVEGTNLPAVQLYAGAGLSDANVRITTASATGIAVSSGGTAETTVDAVDISEVGGATGTGLDMNPNSGRVVVTDSNVDAQNGLAVRGGIPFDTAESLVVRRSTVAFSQIGLLSRNSDLKASSSVVYQRSASGSMQAVRVINDATYANSASTADLAQMTVDGKLPAFASNEGLIAAVLGSAGPGATATATVRGSAIRDFLLDLHCVGAGSSIGVSRSNYSSAQVDSPACLVPGAGNVNVDPGYENGAAHDFHLADDSPMIDAAGTDPPAGDESATDRDGAPRVFDGDGDGIAERDIGAYEVGDRVSPETTIDSGPQGLTRDSTPSFDLGSSESGSGFECNVDGSGWSSCPDPVTLGPLPDGPHSLDVRAIDPAGNLDASPASRSFVVDATPPDTTIDSGPQGPTRDATPAFDLRSSEPGSGFECNLDGAGWSGCADPVVLGPLVDGPHTLQVRGTDPAGNPDPSPVTRAFTVDTAVAEPLVRFKGTQRQRGRRIVVAIEAGAAENVTALAGGEVKIGRRAVTLKRASAPVSGGGTTTLLLSPERRKDSKAIVKKLRRGRKLGASLSLTLTDGLGNAYVATPTVRLK